MKKKLFSQYIGIALGVIYGLVFRLIVDIDYLDGLYNLYSITFVWIVPILVGLLPIIFSSNKLYLSPFKLFFYPIITVFLFLIVTLIVKLEDIFCLFIIGIPFFIAAGVAGVLLGSFVKDKVVNRKIYSLFLLPLILNPIENLFPNTSEEFSVEHSIIINKSRSDVFPNLLEVQTINEEQYGNGFFQLVGIPKPINSKIYKSNEENYRLGFFTDNFKLYESIAELKENEFVSFQIHLDKSQLRNKPTDIHLIKSDYFKFGKISYKLIEIDHNKTKVILSCDYILDSKMNSYANFWAESIIIDFEKRLLKSIKKNIES